MRFKDIVGQRDTINQMVKIVDSGRVSHAQLLIGDSENGSLALALAYLQYLCCEHRVHYEGGDLAADSCGECPSCKKISQLMHPDLHLVFPTAGTPKVSSNPYSELFQEEFYTFVRENQGRGSFDEWFRSLGIEKKMGEIRALDADYIERLLGVKSYEGGWKMVLVWMADKMNTSFANKLLKTLEEPSDNTLLLLVADSDETLLPTIRSRVQTLRMRSEGEGRRAADNEQYARLMIDWLRMLFKLKMKELSLQVEKMAALNREELRGFLSYCLDTMRSCFLHGTAGLPCQLDSGDAKFDANFPNMITVNNIEMITSAFDNAIFAIGRNANAKIAMMELSFRISKALKKR